MAKSATVRRYRIEVAPTGLRSLEAVKDRKLRRELAKTIDGLTLNPAEKGKPLRTPLEGIYSVRAARDRFRVLYRVDSRRKLVSVLLVAVRSPRTEDDVYALAKRLLSSFLEKKPE